MARMFETAPKLYPNQAIHACSSILFFSDTVCFVNCNFMATFMFTRDLVETNCLAFERLKTCDKLMCECEWTLDLFSTSVQYRLLVRYIT